MSGAHWRPAAHRRQIIGVAAGCLMLVVWWFYELEDTGWEFAVYLFLMWVGTGMFVDNLRDLLRARRSTD